MKNLVYALLAGLLAAFGGYAFAQVVIPQVSNVGTADLFQDVVNGQPSVPSYYATAAQIAGAPGYTDTVQLTAFSLTFAKGQMNITLRPAGTLATGTITTEANPSDGQVECMFSTQTQTALTFSPNTTVFTQTINNAITAMTANTRYCYQFNKAASAWSRIQ